MLEAESFDEHVLSVQGLQGCDIRNIRGFHPTPRIEASGQAPEISMLSTMDVDRREQGEFDALENARPLSRVDADLFDLAMDSGMLDTYNFSSDVTSTYGSDWEKSIMKFGDLDNQLAATSWMPEPMVEEPEEIQTEAQQNGGRRRRDYTKEEKNAFEQWIKQNPKPNKAQKTAFAMSHDLTSNQLHNLINNRRRRRTIPALKISDSDLLPRDGSPGLVLSEPGLSTGGVENISFEDTNRDRQNSLEAQQPLVEIVQAADMAMLMNDHDHAHGDGDAMSLPISNSNLLQVLSKKPSYSSIEEYLKSPEEAVPFESIRRASAESHRPDLSMNIPPLSLSPVELRSKASVPELLSRASLSSRESRPRAPHNISSPSRGGNGAVNFLSVPGAWHSRQNSLDSTDGHETASTFGSIESFAASFASSGYAPSWVSSTSANSRFRTKNMRRQRAMSKRIAFFNCSFCNWGSKTREKMIRHETQTHCLPQTFPCTFCNETFASTKDWENHENKFHCQPQVTWFCMLDGRIDVQHCLFCDALAPFRSHYKDAHDLHPCNLPLISRTFSTRYDVMSHLVKVHQMTEDEVSFIKDGLDVWSVRLNAGHNSGLWKCGYCGIMGADWDHRLIHIKNHWHDGGPRMTKMHPWSNDRACLKNVSPDYLERLRQGRAIQSRHHDMYFHGFQAFEAALRHRAMRPSHDKPLDDGIEIVPDVKLLIKKKSTPSFFAHLAARTRAFLGIARARRKRGQKEHG